MLLFPQLINKIDGVWKWIKQAIIIVNIDTSDNKEKNLLRTCLVLIMLDQGGLLWMGEFLDKVNLGV